MVLLGMDEVSRRVNFSDKHIYKLIAQGMFPDPVRTGRNSITFLESDIDAWIQARIEDSKRNGWKTRPRGPLAKKVKKTGPAE
jgi:prophage regulatory protein